MSDSTPEIHPLKIADFRFYWMARFMAVLATMGMVVVIGYQAYDIARSDYGMSIREASLQLGLLGFVLVVIAIGQFIESNILTPKLVGESVGLHPVWLMLALLAFGSLFGFTGLLLAVPIAAAVGVLMRFGLRNYLASPLYLGRTARAREGETV